MSVSDNRLLGLALSLCLIAGTGAANAQVPKGGDVMAVSPRYLSGQDVGACMRAAHAGDADAQLRLGDSYSRPDHTPLPLDYREAAKWYARAAAQENPVGIYRLGEIADLGLGRSVDPVIAFDYFKRSAALGLVPAMYAVGQAYLSGRGVAQNHTLALSFLTDASKRGYVPAQVLLGTLYMNDHAVTDASARDLVTAYGWLSLAAGSDHPMSAFAKIKRDECRGVMSISQVMDSQSRSLNASTELTGAIYYGPAADSKSSKP